MNNEKIIFFLGGLLIAVIAYFLKDLHQSWKKKHDDTETNLKDLELARIDAEISLRKEINLLTLAIAELKVEMRLIREVIGSVDKMKTDLNVLHANMRAAFPQFYKNGPNGKEDA